MSSLPATRCQETIHSVLNRVAKVDRSNDVDSPTRFGWHSIATGAKRVKVGDRVLAACSARATHAATAANAASGSALVAAVGSSETSSMNTGRKRWRAVRRQFDLPVPSGVEDEQLLLASDILPTGDEVGVLNGSVRPGDVVAAVGSGPIGLAAITTAQLSRSHQAIPRSVFDQSEAGRGERRSLKRRRAA